MHSAECSVYITVCGLCASGQTLLASDVVPATGRRGRDADEDY